jgi:hypothetical protein
VLCRLVQVPRAVLDQRGAVRVDDLERVAQVVRDRVAERLQLPVLAFELLDQGGPGLREVAGGARLGGLELLAEQLVPDLAVLVLELFAADLRAYPGLEHIELVGLLDVVVGAVAEADQHRLGVVHGGHHDQRDVPDGRRGLDPLAGLAAVQSGHQEIEQDAVDGLHGEQLKGLLARVG